MASALAWLWRLGSILDSPEPGAVGFGGVGDAEGLTALVEEGALAGAVVFAPEASGHAVVSNGVLVVAVDPDAEWGTLGMVGVLVPIAAYLVAQLDRPLVMMPAIGLIRVDDLPGTAQHQLEGRAKGDRRQRRRLRRYVRAFRRQGGVLNVAVPAEAFRDEVRVPLDEVWPNSIAEFRRGAEAGAVEAVCHGLLHLDTARLAEGEIEFREFAKLSAAEAGERIDAARAWQQRAIGPSSTFVAAAWTYSEETLQAADERDLPCFMRCRPGFVFEPGRIYETLIDGRGIHRLDYRPLAGIAGLGLPPTLVMHGTLLDSRAETLSLPRDGLAAARLAVRRDLSRLPHVTGVRWVGAGEYVERLERHAEIVVRDGVPIAPKGTAMRLWGRSGIEETTA